MNNNITNTKKHPPDYDALLLWAVTSACNFHCHYCISKEELQHHHHTSLIDITAARNTLNNLHRRFHILFTGGGEPFLCPNIVEGAIELSRDHYISFFTNLTLTDKIREVVNKINPGRLLRIMASFHIQELEKLNLIDTFFSNYLYCNDHGIPILCFTVAYPPVIERLNDYTNYFKVYGIKPAVKPFIGTWNGKEYPQSYTDKELSLMNPPLTPEQRDSFTHNKGKLCNAGVNTAVIRSDGTVHICFDSEKTIGNMYRTINFLPGIFPCPYDYCACYMKDLDPGLFTKVST